MNKAFKSLIDGLNDEEFTLDSYSLTYFDKHIVAMHFHHNPIFIAQGVNNEGGYLAHVRMPHHG
jgi:hypothetical protein